MGGESPEELDEEQEVLDGNLRTDAATAGSVSIRWSSVAMLSTLIAVSSLLTLIILVAIEDFDALTTVALGLAVVTFGAQLIAFVAQSRSSAQQLLEAERVNTETRSLLAEVRTNTQAMLSTLSQQFDRLLNFVLRAPMAAGDRTEASAEPVFEEIRNSLDQFFEAQSEELRKLSRPEPSRSKTVPGVPHRVVKEPDPWPSEQAFDAALDEVAKVSAPALEIMKSLAIRENVRGREAGFKVTAGQLYPDNDWVRELENLGFVTKSPLEKPGRVVVRLTTRGSEVAAPLGVSAPLPIWLVMRLIECRTEENGSSK